MPLATWSWIGTIDTPARLRFGGMVTVPGRSWYSWPLAAVPLKVYWTVKPFWLPKMPKEPVTSAVPSRFSIALFDADRLTVGRVKSKRDSRLSRLNGTRLIFRRRIIGALLGIRTPADA